MSFLTRYKSRQKGYVIREKSVKIEIRAQFEIKIVIFLLIVSVESHPFLCHVQGSDLDPESAVFK